MRTNLDNHRLAALLDHLLCDVVVSEDEFIALKVEWDELLDSCSQVTAFQSFAWNYSWWKHLSDGAQLAVVTVRENGRLVGVGPFVMRSRWGVREVQLMGENQYLGLLLANEREDVAEAIALRLGSLLGSGVVHIPNYAAGDFGIDVLSSALMAIGWSEDRWVRDISHYIYCDSGHEGYLAGKSPKSRRNLRYNSAKLGKKGMVVTEHFEKDNLSLDVILRMAKIQEKSWLLRRGADYLAKPFYQDLIPALAKGGHAEAFILSVDGADLAFILNFAVRNIHMAIATGFDEKFEDVSPGQILWHNVIQSVLDRGNVVYDLPFGDAKYKRFWCNRTKRVFRAVYYRGLAGWLLSWFPHRLYAMAARHDRLRQVLRRLRQIKTQLRQSPPPKG